MNEFMSVDELDEYDFVARLDAFDIFGIHNFDFSLSECSSDDSRRPHLHDDSLGVGLGDPLDELLNWSNESFDIVTSSSESAIYTPKSSAPRSPEVEAETIVVDRDCCEAATLTMSAPGYDGKELPSNHRSKKRKYEDAIIVFSAKEGHEIASRRRKPFDESRRQAVALNRLIGACIQCKLHKGSCNFGIPCDQCIKRAGSSALARQLCTRQSLVATRFNNVDLLELARIGDLLDEHREPFIAGTVKDIYLSYPACCNRTSKSALVKTKIQSFKPRNGFDPVDGPKQSILRRGYNQCERFWAADQFCAIPENSLPSLDDLIQCCTDAGHSCNAGPFAGLHKAFSEFGEIYQNGAKELPMKPLLTKIMRMKRLFSVYRRCASMKYSPDDVETLFTSSRMMLQLRHHAGKGIMSLEAEILDGLDKLLYSPESIGRRNPLATWVCLWFLVLIYKEQMGYIYFHYLQVNSILGPLYGLAGHIYNTLTAIYAALYRTTTPLTFDWRTDEVSEMLGGDVKLIKCFCNIKTEMFWFHAEKDQLFHEDALFKMLVIDNESKLVSAHKQLAKKQGLL